MKLKKGTLQVPSKSHARVRHTSPHLHQPHLGALHDEGAPEQEHTLSFRGERRKFGLWGFWWVGGLGESKVDWLGRPKLGSKPFFSWP